MVKSEFVVVHIFRILDKYFRASDKKKKKIFENMKYWPKISTKH